MNIRNAVAIAFLAYAMLGVNASGDGGMTPPSAPYAAAVAEAKSVAASMSQGDRQILAGLFMGLSRAIKADAASPAPVIATTDKLRAFNVASLNFVWRGYGENMAGKYPGLSAAVEKAISSTLGNEVKTLEVDKAVETMEALSWAFH